MLSRGRSRLVSQAALARQASQERRTSFLHHNSPPTPPTSLEDQVHRAYALDDIHLAKILLLKLKGIQVSSDDDPRIAAVQDEDFDLCFVPAGRLTLDEADQKAVQEAQRRERERWQEQLRADRLRACEQIWLREKQRIRQERLLVLRAREQAVALENERKRQEAERVAELERVRYHQRLMATSWQHPRSVLSYDSLPQTRNAYPCAYDNQDEPFQYEFMTPTASATTTRPVNTPRPHSPIFDLGISVSFTDVLTSMHGPLFPPPASTPQPRQDSRHSELFESLLQVIEWEDGERKREKGKAPLLERTPSYRSSRRDGGARCAACSASAMSATTFPTGPRSAPSRSGSWLSFTSNTTSTTSSSCGSTSTAPTTPSTSPISSWLKKTPLSQPPVSKSFRLKSEYKPTPLRHSCHSHSRLTVVPAGPLDLTPVPDRTPKEVNEDPARVQTLHHVLDFCGPDDVDGKRSSPLVVSVAERMSYFLRLQTASISATFFSITVSEQRHEPTLGERRNTTRQNQVDAQKPPAPAQPGLKLNPPGYRVRAADASIFILPSSDDDPSSSVHFIPLLSPHDPDPDADTTSSSSSSPPRTSLPRPPALVFPPPPPLPRSPLRQRDPPAEGAGVLLRMRPVANPALLRLRALQNVLWERGVGWEGRGREGGLGAGRERLCRIGFDGLGRSALACEVRQQQQQQQWVM